MKLNGHYEPKNTCIIIFWKRNSIGVWEKLLNYKNNTIGKMKNYYGKSNFDSSSKNSHDKIIT